MKATSLLYLAICLLSLASCDRAADPGRPQTAPSGDIRVKIHNPSDFARRDESVFLSYASIGASPFWRALAGDRELPLQTVDSDADGQADGVRLLLDLNAGEELLVVLQKLNKQAERDWPQRTQAEVSVKEGGQWQVHPDHADKKAYVGGRFHKVNEVVTPSYYTDHSNWIRYEGPGIESDLVAYRVYLDWRNGFDIFGKRVPTPVLQNIGLDGYESYHNMQDWGMDILKVDTSLGTGGFAYWNGKSVEAPAKVEEREVKIIDSGDIYSAFLIQYHDWDTSAATLNLSATFSMSAGSRLVRTQLTMTHALETMAIGVVKHENTEELRGPGPATSGYSYLGSWGKQSLAGDMLGMAVIFKRQDLLSFTRDNSSYIALVKPEDKVLNYAFLAAWQGELGHGIASRAEFRAALDRECEKLSQPLEVTIGPADAAEENNTETQVSY